MFIARTALASLALFSAAPAWAGPVGIQVLSADGQPLPGAVVTLTLPGTPMPAAHGPYRVAQRNIAFDPRVLIVPVGAAVSFPNLDRVRHHVYSFSSARRFDLKLYGRDESRSVTFDKPGAVALGCNIHDSMSGVIYVTATPYAAVTDGQGRVSFAGVGAGRGTLLVWHPSIRAKGNAVSQPAALTGGGLSTVVRLRP
ncbi:plastocyanin [Sphingomonas jinjuensis]|uniref:Plastocyanin n=1 Tax=Sphingomonas jinjuensis TaxID=535907 RepID=A0A840F8L0_9SPHN|nr:methylamine utilization protein [Sphingomonas jinjuensis]MBB4154310.1 plastocyanin [Sphingomonas jinjuensis]